MNTMALDTYALALSYKKVGFTDEQVEAMVDAARKTSGLPDISQLATKADIDTSIAKLKAELLIWNISTIMLINGFIATILFFALRLTPTRRAWLAGRPENGRLLERKRKLPSRRSQWPLLGSVQEMQNL